MFCPICKDEYQEGLDICNGCRVQLECVLPEGEPLPSMNEKGYDSANESEESLLFMSIGSIFAIFMFWLS